MSEECLLPNSLLCIAYRSSLSLKFSITQSVFRALIDVYILEKYSISWY